MQNDIVARYRLKFNDLASKKLLRVAGAARVVNRAMRAAALASVALGVAGIGAAAKLANHYADRADEIQKFTKETGFAWKSMQQLEFVAGRQGASFETVKKGVQKFNKALGELKSGTGDLASKLKFIDPALAKQLTGIENNEQAYWAMLRAIAAQPDAAKKAALAASAFGTKGGAAVLRMTADGVEAIDALKARADKLRPPLGDKALNAAAAYKDAMLDVKTALLSVADSGGGKLLPTLTSLMTRTADWIASNRELINAKLTTFFNKVAEAAKRIDFNKVIAGVVAIAASLATFGAIIGKVVGWMGGLDNAIGFFAASLVAAKVAPFFTILATAGPLLFKFAGGLKVVGLAALSAGKALIPLVLSIGLVPIAIIAAAVAIAAGIAWMIMNFDKVKKFAKSMGIDLDQVWAGIKTGFNNLKNAAITVWNGIKFAIANPIEAAKMLVVGHINFIKNIFTSVSNAIAAVASAIWTGISSTVTNAASALKAGVVSHITALQGVWSSVMTGISNIASNIWESIKATFLSGVDFLKNIVNGLSESVGLGKVINDVKSAQNGKTSPTTSNAVQSAAASRVQVANAFSKPFKGDLTVRAEKGSEIVATGNSTTSFAKDGANFSLAA